MPDSKDKQLDLIYDTSLRNDHLCVVCGTELKPHKASKGYTNWCDDDCYRDWIDARTDRD